MGHDEVARGEHLARDFGVARFVGLPESVDPEMKEEQRRGQYGDRAEAGRKAQSRRLTSGGHVGGLRHAPQV